jgi:endonuclease YncB( thermonuclease family)
MFLALGAFLMSIFVGGDSAPKSTTKTRHAETIPVRELAVIDGDTLQFKGHRPLRLQQINAPAISHCYARQSQVRLAELVGTDGTLTANFDPKLPSARYGRTMVYLDKNHHDIGAQLVLGGYARPLVIAHQHGVHAKQLFAAQASARQHKRGLWESCPRSQWPSTKAGPERKPRTSSPGDGRSPTSAAG